MIGLRAQYPQCKNCGREKEAPVDENDIVFLNNPPRLKILTKCNGCGKILSLEVPIMDYRAKPTTILVGKKDFDLSVEQVGNYEAELIFLEKELKDSTHTEFWSVDSYFIHNKDNGASDESIRDEFRDRGFKCLVDKYGLEYIRQIYLPRM